MSYDLIGGGYPFDEFDDGVAGEEEYDDDAIAGALEIVGFEDDDAIAGLSDEELDAIAGIEDDLEALAGYEVPTSEVTKLLEATAGFAPQRGQMMRPARSVQPARPTPVRRAAVRRVVRTVNVLGRQLRRERARNMHMASALRRQRGAAHAQGPSVRTIPAAGGGARALVERKPQMSSVDPIGINSDGPIPAGETRTITVRPQELFRPIRYHVAEAVAQNFLINSITIGKSNQFGTSGALPASTFSVEDLKFAWRTCQPGQDITVVVQNITASPHMFASTMWGDSTA